MPDLVAEALKESILQGQFKGGVQLKQDEIAKQFDVSLIPVREALIHLQSQKLVQCIRNKGAIVTTLSIREMQNIFEMWKVIEAGLGAMNSHELEQEAILKLTRLNNEMKKEISIFEFNRYNRAFYEVMCHGRGNKEILEMYSSMFIRVERYLMYIDYLVPTKNKTIEYQEQIIECFKKKDYNGVQVITTNYIDYLYKSFINYIEINHDTMEIDFNTFLPFEEGCAQIGV